MAFHIGIVDTNSLMARGLSLLLSQKGFPVMEVKLNHGGVLQPCLRPGDVLIWDCRDTPAAPRASLLEQLVREQKLTVIGVDPGENKLELYLDGAGAEELVKLIGLCREWRYAQWAGKDLSL